MAGRAELEKTVHDMQAHTSENRMLERLWNRADNVKSKGLIQPDSRMV